MAALRAGWLSAGAGRGGSLPPCSGDEFQVGVTEGLGCRDGEVDLGEGFLVQDDLNGVGDVEANEFGQHSARVSQEGVAEGGVSGDALR